MAFADNGKGEPDLDPELSDVEELSSTVDEMRQLLTDAGLRPYRIFSIIINWSSGELYRGDSTVICEKEFLPTPLIDLRPMYTQFREPGLFEHGAVVMREVSPSITEDQIKQLCFNGVTLPQGQQGYIEVRHDQRKRNDPLRRRYVVRGVPWMDAENFQWIVTLSDEAEDSDRFGNIPENELNPIRVFRPT